MTDTMNEAGGGHWFTVEFGLDQPTAAEVDQHVVAISQLADR
jgi:hypothetical protein